MPPRAIWSGSISFGLVNVPVRMYSAISETDLRFHLIHEPDGGRIGYQKICKEEGQPVPEDEIVKGFEFKEDEFVVLTEEDFLPRPTVGRREGLCAAPRGDGEDGSGRDRQVRDARPAASRLPPCP